MDVGADTTAPAGTVTAGAGGERMSDPLSYAFGYLLFNAPGYFRSRAHKYDKLNDSYLRLKEMYDRTDIDAYEWRDKHSQDPLVGGFWRKANQRDLYAEKKRYQEDYKKNSGYNWRDNAYPRTAYGSAFAGAGTHTSPEFEVNDAIMQLYRGVKIW